MREVRKGDEAFIYHTGKEKAVIGTARIVSDPYPDPDADNERIIIFDIRPGRRLAQPVTLAAIKADPKFADFALVRMARLSVMPVPAAVWKRLLSMGGASQRRS